MCFFFLSAFFWAHFNKTALRSTEGFCVASSPPVVAFSPVIHDLLPALSFLEMEDGRRRFFPDGGPPLGQSGAAAPPEFQRKLG